ncbi:hypothetical protein [Limnohabitans sp. Rim8]|uniref:hypothetical protein n=1 Tax=Limnohabitans sp. Rim8 TaxID=1100718 RepID=UPI0025DD5A1B|nr:hypothetical protein [Limnohabitans sp. Rim8]
MSELRTAKTVVVVANYATQVFDHHGFAQFGGGLGLYLTGKKVGWTTGRVGHDQADGFDRVGLREGVADCGGGHEQAAQKGFDVHVVS